MNLSDAKYKQFALVREMLETGEIVQRFDHSATARFASFAQAKKALFLSGEGSSRIFPAKRAVYSALKNGNLLPVMTEGATQALEYDLTDFALFGASNSGKTKEVVRLFMKMQQEKHDAFFGLTAHQATTLESLAMDTHVLNCGKEDAVAATKSVIEQGLFYDSLLRHIARQSMDGLPQLADDITRTLTIDIDPELIALFKQTDTIYFAGRNNGVAEELTLKTNEITRKKSDYLEGTYAVHGIEEVMDRKEVVVIIDPFESEEEKFAECLSDGVGMTVVAIASRQTKFPTIVIPDGGPYKEYVQLAAGWNLLVDIGLSLGIDLDKPVRARKVGNEYIL